MQSAAGLDIGTSWTKAVVVAGDSGGGRPQVLGRALERTGVQLEKAATAALAAARAQAGFEPRDPCYVATTGFGRHNVPCRDIQITEITTAARGAFFLFPRCASVLDIGSQSTRAVGLTEAGKVRCFKTNDKCAAGSGSFIARAAKYLEVGLEDAGTLALKATNPQPISSICAVLAESEIINHVSSGVSVEDILRGIYDSLASRAALLLKRDGLGSELTFIGGVAHQAGMVRALEERLRVKVNVPEDCEYVCALGAALLGLRRLEKAAGSG